MHIRAPYPILRRQVCQSHRSRHVCKWCSCIWCGAEKAALTEAWSCCLGSRSRTSGVVKVLFRHGWYVLYIYICPQRTRTCRRTTKTHRMIATQPYNINASARAARTASRVSPSQHHANPAYVCTQPSMPVTPITDISIRHCYPCPSHWTIYVQRWRNCTASLMAVHQHQGGRDPCNPHPPHPPHRLSRRDEHRHLPYSSSRCARRMGQ